MLSALVELEPTATVERDERSNGVDRESVRSLTYTSSSTAVVSQVSPNKPRGQRRRARRKNASPWPPDEMPDPETGCMAVSCRRPTYTVPRVEQLESRLRQSVAGGVQKASATPVGCCPTTRVCCRSEKI